MSTSQVQTTFYLSGSMDPIVFFRRGLTGLAPLWSGDPNLAEVNFSHLNRALFDRFWDLGYRQVSLTAGLPRNDNGQTVRLYREGEFRVPGLEDLVTEGLIPEHLIGPCRSLKPDQMAGTYRTACEKDARNPDIPTVTERWFFGYRPGYRPRSFAELANSLGALRSLSGVTHDLESFTVVLMDTGTYVKLSAQEVPDCKPPFRMGR